MKLEHIMSNTDLFTLCAEAIAAANGLLITAGAGMGVDSGLPDFRGKQGFWRAYPALGQAGIPFERIANPNSFIENPRFAWGFCGHRLNLYRRTVPHAGFEILRQLGAMLPYGAFVFTSNVDGQFQKAGFSSLRVEECHGSIHYLQCLNGCTPPGDWPADDFVPEVDEARCLLLSDMPRCPVCCSIARPSILMFNDEGWLGSVSTEQEMRREAWLKGVQRPLVIEIGAGTNIPSVRLFSERFKVPLIRINPTDSITPHRKGISLSMGGLEALTGIGRACGLD